MPNEAPSLRETIESAMSAPEPAPEAVEPVEVEAAPEPVEAEPQETAAEAAQRARDEKGRFAPKSSEKPAAAPKGVEKADPGKAAAADQGKPAGVTPPAPAGQPAAEPFKAPQSWKPAVRELAAKLPAEFRPILDEAHRREIETTRVLSETAEARRTVEQVRTKLAPFEGLARANGMEAMDFAGSVLQTAAALQMGTPQQRAAVVAQIIGTYGVDVDAVNAAMQGQPQPHAAAQPPQDVSRLVQQEFQRIAQEAQAQKAATAWQEFQASAPEFLADVQEDMRFILERAGREGGNMTYQQAYDRACKLNEGVQEVLAARKSVEAARAQAPTVQRAKVAASSIKATPVAAVTRPSGPRSLRDTIEEAVAAQRT